MARCREGGIEPQTLFSGTLSLRTSPERHPRTAAAVRPRSIRGLSRP
ncbi:toxin-antitoxin system HicB family antitoxin [Jiella flava]